MKIPNIHNWMMLHCFLDSSRKLLHIVGPVKSQWRPKVFWEFNQWKNQYSIDCHDITRTVHAIVWHGYTLHSEHTCENANLCLIQTSTAACEYVCSLNVITVTCIKPCRSRHSFSILRMIHASFVFYCAIKSDKENSARIQNFTIVRV